MEPRLLVLLALATAAIAGPITVKETNECATQCSPSTKLTYTPGMTYLYDYRVDYVTSMSGASEDAAKLTLTTTAELEVLGQCEMVLSLRDTRLFHSDTTGALKAADREEIFRRGLEGSALRFSYQDGVIEHVCAGIREESWALNVKKGILSAFQNSMDDLNQPKNVTETDVMGSCETRYQAVSDGYYSSSVKKTKDILTCTDRHDYNTILQMVPYNVPSELQSIPLMKTSHECEQVIQKGGLLESATCTESHIWRPFSYDKSGGVTSVKQTLTYKTYNRGVSSRQYTISSRDSLLFDHSATRPSPKQVRERVEQKLSEICESTSYDVRPESPRLFSELVYALKSLDEQAMEEISRQLKSKSLCPTNNKAYKMFLDALPMASSTASVSLMTSLIINEDVQGLQAKAWIASLALINAPTSEMLLDAKTLIDSDKFREDALLPVSSMVNNFCFRSTACDQSYAVLSIMASLERYIGSQCDASGKDFHQILLSLRAIGNAGHAIRAVPVITKCLTNSDNPLEIRVAAATAFRRMPCDAESTDLWNTYENSNLDSELRIAAYLALMRCPSDVTLNRMAASLGGDLDEQVGAFVYSHMTNLKQTSDPHKQMVARALDDMVIPTKYESSPMKASTNLEASALINKINAGFVAESNLVWSNNAQVPRSASANLTVELFGQSINLFDFGGRVEGLEHLIKNLFGPYLGDEDAKKTKPISLENIHGSVYGRFFGNEMLFLHSNQVSSSLDKMTFKWLDLLISLAQKQEVAFTHGGQFIDVSMIIPSAAGLPIHIDVNGSAVVDVLLNGKADLRKLGSSPMSLDIDGEIRPSGALEITGAMSVNAFVTKTGLRMRNTMHTSTSLKGRIQMERGQQLSIELDTPKDKMEIFDARSKFFIVHNNVEQEQNMITENRKEFELCTCAKTAEITGAVLCGQVIFPNASMQSEGPYFPLTGPSSASLVLRKTDTHSGYKLLAKRVQNKKMNVAQISFNTPGSSVNRLVLVDMTMNYPAQSVDAQLVTPWKKASLAGALVNKRDMKSLSGSITIDETDIYGWTSEMKISKSKGRVQYTPLVEIRQPGMDTVQMNGFVNMVNGMKSMDMDFSLTGLQKLPYNLKMTATNTKKERSLAASFSQDGGKSHYTMETSNRFSLASKRATVMSTSSMLKVNTPKKEIVSMTTTADYRENKSLKLSGVFDVDRLMRKPASFKLNVLKDAKKRGVRYNVNGNVKSNVFTGRVDSNTFMKASGLVSVKTTVDYNVPKVAKNKIVLNGKFNDRSTRTYTKYILKSTVDVKKNPEYNIGLDFGLDHKKKTSEAELEVRYGADPKDTTKRLYLSTALTRKIPSAKNAVLVYKMKAKAPEHRINLLLSGKHTHNTKLIDSAVKLSYAHNKAVSASVFLDDKTGKANKVNGRASVAWPGQEYVLISKLNRESNNISHGISLEGTNGLNHSINTVYKNSDSNNHEFSTMLNLQGLKKTTISGSANLLFQSTQVSGLVKYGEDIYGVSSTAKQSKRPGGTLVVEAFYPDRRIVMRIDGEKAKNKLEGNIETSWDADKDQSKKITLGGSVYNKKSRNSVSMGGDMSFTSPFDNFEKLASTFKYGSDSSQHDITGKVSWGKSKRVMSSLTLKRPITLRKFEASVEAKSSFKKMRSASAEILHSWENALSTVFKGSLNKEHAKLVIEGEGSLNKMKGSVLLDSTIKKAENVSITFSHRCGNGKVASRAVAVYNRKSYGCDLDMQHSLNGWKVNTKGDLLLITPKSKISTNWLHKSNENKIKSQISSKWGGEKLNILLHGSHDQSSTMNINGELKIESPWKFVGDVVVSLNHKHGEGLIKNKASLVKDGSIKALSDVKLSYQGKNVDLDITISPPQLKDISGKLNAKYDTYPVTASAEFQWHPRKKVTTETSISAERWENAAFDLKITTPVRGYRNINFMASNRKEGSEMVSQANLDYGPTKSFDFETRHALEGQNKMMRLKILTPYDQVKSLNTGLRLDGHHMNFDSSADFELVPLVGKYKGFATFNYEKDMTGTLRLDTPHPEYPFFELTTSNSKNNGVRKSLVEAKFDPRQVYSVDATYSFDMPISLEANIHSPYPEYDNLGLVFQHAHSSSNIASHGELRYQPDKRIEGDLNADWSSNIDASILLKTPFLRYEISKMALRHQGDLADFSTHGEVNVAEKSVVADVNFKAGHTTTGTFTLSSPFEGMKNVELNLKKKGRARNFKGEIELIVNDKKIDADYNHRFTKQGLKSAFKLTTPFTENIRLSLEHSGEAEKFTNEISANYGRKYDVETLVSFEYTQPAVSSQSMIKYKLGGRRNTARLHLNKNGPLTDMSFSGSVGLNDDEINVSGSWKTVETIEGSIKMNTPFKGFKSTALSLSHDGQLNDFKTSVDITYMDNKNINGKIALATQGLRAIHLDSEIATPFKKFPSASLILNHIYDDYRNILNGDVSLTTPAARFGTGTFTYMMAGSLDKIDVVTSAKRNGREVGSLKLGHAVTASEVLSTIQAEASEYPALAINFYHAGDFDSFDTVASGSIGGESVFSEIHKRGTMEDLTVGGTARYNADSVSVAGTWNSQRGLEGNLEVKTPFEGFQDVGMTISHTGDASGFSSSGKVVYMDNKEIIGKVDVKTDGMFVSELSTPFKGYEFSKIEANGAIRSESGDMTSKITLVTSINDFGTGEATFSKNGNLDNLVVDGSILRNNVKLGSVKLTNSRTSNELHTALNGKISEFPEVFLTLDHNGDLTTFKSKGHASVGDISVVEGEVNFDKAGSKIVSITGTFGQDSVSGEVYKRGTAEDFTVGGTARYNTDSISATGTWNSQSGLNGNLEVKTPFEKFHNVGITISHSGDASDFSSSGKVVYMDNKAISGNIDVKSVGNFVTELSTPFEGYEYSKVEANGAFDKVSGDMNSKITLMTSINDFGTGKATFSKYGNLDNLVVDGSILRNNVKLGSVKITNSHTNKELHTAFNGKISEMPEMSLTIDNVGEMSSFNSKAIAKLGDLSAIECEVNFDEAGSKQVTVTGTLGQDTVSAEIYKRGTMEDLTVGGTARYNTDSASVTGTWNSQRGLEGNLEVKTPFEGFYDVGMTISHTGDASDFSSSGKVVYMDNKVIRGKVDVKSDSAFVSELSTPFEGYEFSKLEANRAFDSESGDMTSKITLVTSINEFGTGEATFSKYGNLNNLVVDGSILRNNVKLGSVKLTNSRTSEEFHTAFNGKVSDFPEVTLTFDHNGDLVSFNSKASASVGDLNTIEGEVKFNQADSNVIANAGVMSRTELYGSKQASLSVKKEGEIDDFSVTVTGKMNDQETTIKGEMKMKDEINGILTINTPLQGYGNVGASFKHVGNPSSFSSEGQMNLIDGEQYSGKINFYRNKYRLVETDIVLYTPIRNVEYTKFEYRHEGQRDSFKCNAALVYGKSKKISYEMSVSTSPNVDFTLDIKTPFKNYENMMASTTVETKWPKLSIQSNINAGLGNQFTLQGSLDASKDISGNINLSTPFEGFSDVGLSFEHAGKIKNFKSGARITYMDGKEISGKAIFKQKRSYAFAELKTPFTGFHSTKYEWTTKTTAAKSIIETYLEYGDGKVTSTETVFTFKPMPAFSVTMKTPMEGYEKMMASASYDDSWPRLGFNSKAKIGRKTKFSIDAAFDASSDISGSIDITTPVDGFKNIGINFSQAGNYHKFDCEGKVTYMDGKDVRGKLSFDNNMWRRLTATAEINTPFRGARSTKAELNYEANSNSISATAALEYGRRQKIDGSMKLTHSPNYDAVVTINTPYTDLKTVRAQGSLDVTAPTYSAGYTINYGYNTSYSANGKLNLYSVDNVDGSLEVVLPIQGIEYTKADYHHKFDSNHYDGSISVTYGNSKTISGELKASTNPSYDITLAIKTPFKSYEIIQGSANYANNGYNTYAASSTLNLGGGYPISVVSSLDLASVPYRASTQISTPFENYRNMELVITHEGSIDEFHCTGFLSTPITNDITAAANMKYNSLLDLEGSAFIKSTFEGMDDLVAEIKTSDISGEKKAHTVFGWTSEKKIAVDAMFSKQDNWYGKKFHGEMNLATPFDIVRSLAIQTQHSDKQEEIKQTFSLEMNDEKLLDVDTEYNSKTKPQASVTFRKPLPMQYTVSASSNAGITEAEVLANWNRDKLNSNVHITASITDKSDSYKMEHTVDVALEFASRKVGIVHKLSSSQPHTSSFGKLYWDSDDNSRIFYDMQLNDNSRRRKEVRDGHFKVGLPHRTLGLSGSYSDNRVVKNGDVTFSWDSDRDDSQVGLKGTITRGDRIKGDVTLSMPAIRKEFRVDGELMSQNGRIILDARTDISYSKDSRKTLTLMSKLEDVSDYYSHYNYSLAVGVSHPYTNVDIQLTSHLGSSDEKTTFGLSTDYMTARRHNKNLGLLAEINKLKRQLNLQITNPMTKMEISGEVASMSPYQVNMYSKVDDVEVFRSDITIDETKKSFEINMYEGQDGVRLSAGYPNLKEFRGEISRMSSGRETTEALLAVRLNTTRLMHTRLHWDPNMVQSVWQAVDDRAKVESTKTAEILNELNSVVADELADKYSDITSALSEELKPLVDELEKEMKQIARKMNKLSREMRTAYDNNDFYIQDMGLPATEAYMKTQEQLASLTREYREAYTQIIQTLRQGLKDMTTFPIKGHYSEMVSSSTAWLSERVYSALVSLESYLAKTSAVLTEYQNTITVLREDVKNSMHNATYVTYLSDSLNSIDVTNYMPSLEIPEGYSTAIHNVHSAVNTKVSGMLDAPGLRRVKGGLNEIYQQGIWAYNFWQVEENIQAHAQRVLTLIGEIVEEELKEYVKDLQGLYQNPVTVWQPDSGEVQADIRLPVDVSRLDEMPDMSPLVNQISSSMPDMSALGNMSETFSNLWKAAEEDDISKQ